MYQVHDIEIPNDSTISSNQCYFIYNPIDRDWFVNDGKLDIQNVNTTQTNNQSFQNLETSKSEKKANASSNGTWLFLDQPKTIESSQRFRINGTHVLAKII